MSVVGIGPNKKSSPEMNAKFVKSSHASNQIDISGFNDPWRSSHHHLSPNNQHDTEQQPKISPPLTHVTMHPESFALWRGLELHKQAFKEMLINRRSSLPSMMACTSNRASIVPVEDMKANETTPLLATSGVGVPRNSALQWFPAPFSKGIGYPKVRHLEEAEGEQSPDSYANKLEVCVERIRHHAVATSKKSWRVVQHLLAMRTRNRIPFTAYALLCLSFLSFSSEGVALDMLGPASPLLKLFWRMLGASLAFFPFALHWILTHFENLEAFWHSLPEGTTTKFLTSAAAYSVLMGTFFFALKETSISHVYLLGNCHSILLVTFRFVFQRARLLRLEIVGTLLGFVGIFVTSNASASSSGRSNSLIVPNSFGGDMLAFTGAVAGVWYLFIVKDIREQLNEWVFLFGLMTFVWIALLPIMYFTIPQLAMTTDPTVGLFGWVHYVGIELYLVFIVTFLGTMGRVRCLKYFDPLIVSCTMLLEPIVASWIGIVLGYDTWPGVATVIGGLSVLVGCFLVLIASQPTKSTPSAVTPRFAPTPIALSVKRAASAKETCIRMSM